MLAPYFIISVYLNELSYVYRLIINLRHIYTTMSNIQDVKLASTGNIQAENDNDEYQLDCDVETSDFQHHQLLHVVSHYSLDHTSFPATD